MTILQISYIDNFVGLFSLGYRSLKLQSNTVDIAQAGDTKMFS